MVWVNWQDYETREWFWLDVKRDIRIDERDLIWAYNYNAYFDEFNKLYQN